MYIKFQSFVFSYTNLFKFISTKIFRSQNQALILFLNIIILAVIINYTVHSGLWKINWISSKFFLPNLGNPRNTKKKFNFINIKNWYPKWVEQNFRWRMVLIKALYCIAKRWTSANESWFSVHFERPFGLLL